MASGDETQAGPRPSLPPHRPGGLADDSDELSETWRMGPSDSPSGKMGFKPRVSADQFAAGLEDHAGASRSGGAAAGAGKPQILASQANEWSPEFPEVEVTKSRKTGLILLFLLALLLVVVIALGLALWSVFSGGEDVPEAATTDSSVATEQDGTTGTETTLPPVETTVVDPNALDIVITEDPFICNGETRAFAQISGAAPNEEVTFESPQTANLRSGTADANGELPIRWSCEPDQAGTAWELTASGVTSGKSATFLFAGAVAPVDDAAPGTDPAAGSLSIVLNENPFACNGEVRIFGRLSGADPGEEVAFTSPQASGITNGVADENGELPIRWSCEADRIGTSWDLTATGVTSGRTVTFSFSGG